MNETEKNMSRFINKVALITGAGSGIGAAAAHRIVAEGGKVFCLDINDEMLEDYAAIIVPSGMVSDRLRYTDDLNTLPPATEFLKRAFSRKGLLKGIICHGMWLVAPAPELVQGRTVVAHNNLYGDVKNMGAIYTDQDVVVDGDLVTGRTGGHCHLFARKIIDMLAES